MKRLIIIMAFIAAAGVACTNEIDEAPLTLEEQTLMTKLVGEVQGEFEQGSLLIKVDAALADDLSAGPSNLTLADVPVNISQALTIRPDKMEIARRYGLDRWFIMNFDAEQPVEKMAREVAQNPSVVSVQYNSFITPVESDKVVGFTPSILTRSSSEEVATTFFNDEYAFHQWNLVNTGDKTISPNAVEGADVGVKDAWRLTAGDPSVIVAVFDCAINNMHEDLRDAVWKNQAEIDGKDGVDDDGNGYIDDKYGFNFVGCTKINQSYSENLLDGKPVEAVKGNSLNWSKGSGHGTHVAGIIGATNNNGKGVSSIAGGTGNGDGVKMMTCQIFNGSASASDAQNAAAFIYAADNGACIAQCSYGSSRVIKSDDIYINGDEDLDINGSPIENAALRYFLDPANSNHESLEGNIAVFAAGNHANPYSSYPGALPYVISVTAFGADYLPGGYTNYGPGCKIAAPGGEFVSQDNYGTMILSTGVSNAAQGSPGVTNSEGFKDNEYVYMQGTSMACPHVSGVISLGLAYAKKLGKKFTRDEFTSMLLTSVNDIDQYLTGEKTYNGTTISLPQYKNQLGTGAVDAWKFLMAIEGTPTVMVKAGEKFIIDLDDYLGEGVAKRLECKVTVNDADKASLGLGGDLTVKDGKIELTCSSIGAGKIIVSSSTNTLGANKDEMDHSIGKMDFSREISIVSRPYASANGGWF